MINVKNVSVQLDAETFNRVAADALSSGDVLVLTGLSESFAKVIAATDEGFQQVIAASDRHDDIKRHNPVDEIFQGYGFFTPGKSPALAHTGYCLVTGETKETLGTLDEAVPEMMSFRQEYYAEVDDVYNKLVSAVMGDCEERGDSLTTSIARANVNATVRLHSYSPVTQSGARAMMHNEDGFQLTEDRKAIVIFDEHVDMGTFSFLTYSGNNSSGLLFKDDETGQFTPFNLQQYVSPDEPALLVFPGKSLELFSDGVYQAKVHKVEARPQQQNVDRGLQATFFMPVPLPGEIITEAGATIGRNKQRALECMQSTPEAEREALALQF